MRPGFFRRNMARLIAIVLACVAYALARQPSLSETDRSELAARFQFSRTALPELAPGWPGHAPRKIRLVNPSLARIVAWVSSVGAGAALGDLDANGLPDDICYVETRTDMVIVTPVPGTGERYKPFALNPSPLPYQPETMAPMGSLLGDLNEDGRLDVLVYFWGRAPIAFLRDGENYVPREIIPNQQRWYTNAATLTDLDGDGHVDLVIANYYKDGSRILDANSSNRDSMQESMSRAENGGRKHFLRWIHASGGPGPTVTFQEALNVLPDDVDPGWTLAVGACDLDGDLLPELYFANDFGVDRLLHNQSAPGQLRFDVVEGRGSLTTPHSSVLGRDSFKGMGVDFADLNGDGLQDIYVSNITTEYGLLESNFVFVSTGHPELMKNKIAPYVNRSEELGLSRSGWAWDAKFADFDNNRVPEAIQAIGFMKGSVNRWPELQELAMGNDRLLHNPRSWPHFQLSDDLSGHEHNPFFVRAADGRYYDLAATIGIDHSQVSRGIAIADVDGDGGLDFVFANQWEPSFYYHNESRQRGSFLGLHLLLPLRDPPVTNIKVKPGHPNADTLGRAAIGATATVYLSDGTRLSSQVDGGNGHSGKRSSELHFGLGQISRTEAVRVDIRWRDVNGQISAQTLSLVPGWHTLMLGSRPKGDKHD